jgi:uncharacterized OB-fold protein
MATEQAGAMTAPPKPVPVPDSTSEGFWSAAAKHVLAIQRCAHCGNFAHPPVLACRACLAPEPAWRFEPVSGRARVHTWTTLRQSFLPAFKGDVPYTVVDGELEEQRGLRMVALLLDPPDRLKLGASLVTVFEDVAPGIAVPRFRFAAA